MTRSDSAIPERVTAEWLREFEKDLDADLKHAAVIVNEMEAAKARGDEMPVDEGDLAWVVEVLKRREQIPELRQEAEADTAREELRMSRRRQTLLAAAVHAVAVLLLVVVAFVGSLSVLGFCVAIAAVAAIAFLTDAAGKWIGVPVSVPVVSMVLLIAGVLAGLGVLPWPFFIGPLLTCAMVAGYRVISGDPAFAQGQVEGDAQ
ncbi:hypothetical protein ACFV9C_42040 [Kribbella sp. NPDC059898]|uniref:hypothetical protein n=1 Tax=Kribbella sp. NPDC059898 TaxID=3346995 RepID=UPI003649B0C8